MEIGNRLRNITDLFDSIVGENESAKFVQKREIIKFSNLIIAEIDTFKEIQCSTHVFNKGQLVSSKIKLSLIERICKLMRMLD